MILSINTSTPQFSVALMKKDGTLLAEYFISPGSGRFVGFMPAVYDLFNKLGRDIQEVIAISVARGPGSFTGLRVGLSAAKGFSQSLDVPIIGVPTLEAMAIQLPFSPYPVCALIDSRGNEVFAAIFHPDSVEKITRKKEDTSMKIENLPQFVDGETVFIGNDFERQGYIIKKVSEGKALLAPAPYWNLKASAVGLLGLRRYLNQDFDSLEELVPSYLRSPDIRPNPYHLLNK